MGQRGGSTMQGFLQALQKSIKQREDDETVREDERRAEATKQREEERTLAAGLEKIFTEQGLITGRTLKQEEMKQKGATERKKLELESFGKDLQSLIGGTGEQKLDEMFADDEEVLRQINSLRSAGSSDEEIRKLLQEAGLI